ncbi:MAG: hypothetical protein BroJett021_26680 [Chloroflexota bacterium]|nr:MAG: hypothetical protein BroJett021_26680 [Chloroflexota bacterium]
MLGSIVISGATLNMLLRSAGAILAAAPWLVVAAGASTAGAVSASTAPGVGMPGIAQAASNVATSINANIGHNETFGIDLP